MNPRLIEIAEEFKVTISPRDKGSVSNLNNIPLHIIQTLDKIANSYGKELFLEFCSTPENHRYIRQFVHTVLKRHEDPAKWKVGRILIPSTSLEDQLTKSLYEIYREFTNELHLVLYPTSDNKNIDYTSLGCFAIRQENARYASERVEGFLPLQMSTSLIEINKEEIPVYHRRWIANRIAICLKADGLLESFTDISVLDRYTSRERLTEDAKIAFKGLLKEKDLNTWKTAIYHGYLGDNSNYQ